MHSYTFPYKEGKDLEGVLGGQEGGWQFMKTRGFQFLNQGFRNVREKKTEKHPERLENFYFRGEKLYLRVFLATVFNFVLNFWSCASVRQF